MSSCGGSNTKLGGGKSGWCGHRSAAEASGLVVFKKGRGEGACWMDRFEVGQCDFETAQGAGCSNRLLFLISSLFYSFSSGL